MTVLDRGTDRSRVSLRATLGLATSAPGFAASTLRDVSSLPASEISLGAPTVDAARVTDIADLVGDEQTIDRFATILDDPALLTGPERGEILQLLGVGWDAQPDAWTAAVEAHREATLTTLNSVRLLPTTTIVALNLGFVVSGAIKVETIFSIPGLGLLATEALSIPDYWILQGAFLVASAAVILANLVANLLYGILDPRVRT